MPSTRRPDSRGSRSSARWLLRAVREQRLEALSDRTCRYTTSDEFKGVLTPLVILFTGGFVRRGFNAVALALKRRAEAEVGSP